MINHQQINVIQIFIFHKHKNKIIKIQHIINNKINYTKLYRSNKIKTSELNDVLQPIIEHYPPPAYKGKFVKIKYIMQLPTPQPQFAFFCNLPQYVKDPYKRFLENKLRENFGFTGVPISVYMRKKQHFFIIFIRSLT